MNKISVIIRNKTVYYITFNILNMIVIFLSMLTSVLLTGSRGGAGFGIPIGLVISYLIMCVVSEYKLVRIVVQCIIYITISLSILSILLQIESPSFIMIILVIIVSITISFFLTDTIYRKLAKTKTFNKIRKTVVAKGQETD